MASIIFGLALLTRVVWLGVEPNGITNDELHFVLNAKAVYYGFSDMSGVWSPLSLTSVPDNPSAELTELFLAPLLGPLDLNLVTARLPFGIINSLMVVVIALIAFEISPINGWIGGLIAIINPWMFYNGRIAFDQPIATFFIMLTVYGLIKLRGSKILLSIITAMLAFFTYIGTKVIFLPLMLGVIGFGWINNQRRETKYYLWVAISAGLMTAYFGYLVLSGPSRVSELATPFSRQISRQVELERSQSIDHLGSRLFINRYGEFANNFIRKYLNSFSPDLLFNKGDETALISLWKHGYFYYFDLIFLLIGGYFLFRIKRRYFYLIAGLLMLAPIPEAIRADNMPAYAFHSCLQFPLLLLVIASGLGRVLSLWPKSGAVIVIIYLISFGRLAQMYFFRYPIFQPEGFFFSNRVVSRYIELEQKNGQKVVVVTNEPSNLFRSYLFYTQQYTKENYERIAEIYRKDRNDINFDNVRFTTDKNLSLNDGQAVYIGQTNYQHFNQSRMAIRQITSWIEMFSIYNSRLCPEEMAGQKQFRLTTGDFRVEKMSGDEFCLKFVYPAKKID